MSQDDLSLDRRLSCSINEGCQRLCKPEPFALDPQIGKTAVQFGFEPVIAFNEFKVLRHLMLI